MLLLVTASCPTPIVVSEGHLYTFERHLLFLKCVWVGACVRAYGRGEESVQGISWKATRKDTTKKDQRMGSDWIVGRLSGGVLSGFSWLRIGLAAGCCEYGDEPSGSGATELV
jgi:hypothetical protein